MSNGRIYNHSGRIASISGVISETTGTVSLRAVFPNPDRLLHSGANGSVLIPEHYTDVITIPQEATFELQDKVFVYKVVDGIARSTQISVSSISDGSVTLSSKGCNPEMRSSLPAQDCFATECVSVPPEIRPLRARVPPRNSLRP